MSFLAPVFLGALVAVAGPLIIHLLNRRRYRTVEWAAMDFLRVAIRRNKRVLEIRDMILLALRTLAVLFFILAMAQPFMSTDNASTYQGEPVHAILVVDNSLSMAYRPLDKTLLEQAQEKAAIFIRELPEGSRISVIPLCGSTALNSAAAYTSSEDALEALSHIELSDRANKMSEAASLAKQAIDEQPDLPTKRVVILSDMQKNAWSDNDLNTSFAGLNNVQLVSVGPDQRSNAWVEELEVRDGMADIETPSIFTATLRYQGQSPRTGIRVTLTAGEEVVDDRTVTLTPGQHLQLVFEHRFDVAGSAGEPLFVPVTLQISGDELNEDNSRSIMVPVVSRIPVVFIDQLGAREYPRMNRYGETYPLRNLLAAPTGTGLADKSMIEVRHLTIDQITNTALADARLVVIAGIRTPTEAAVEMLREYADQGGQIFIAAGGEFEPLAWHESAWKDGTGILPAPLKELPIGQLPPPTGVQNWPVFKLNPNALSEEIIDLELTEAERRAIISLPFFYKAVAIDTEGLDAFTDAMGETLADTENQSLPSWLKWTPPNHHLNPEQTVEQKVARARTRVMGEYDNGEPFLLRRYVGKGQIVMMTTGCYPAWNNLAADAGVILLDGLLRAQLGHSMPNRDLVPAHELVLPVLARDQKASFEITHPGKTTPESIFADPINSNRFGLRLSSLNKRGVYGIERLSEGDREDGWKRQFALAGPASESELSRLNANDFKEAYQSKEIQWVSNDGSITLDGGFTSGRRLWKLFLLLAVTCLLIEMLMLRETKLQGRSS